MRKRTCSGDVDCVRRVYVHVSKEGGYPQTSAVCRILHYSCIPDTHTCFPAVYVSVCGYKLYPCATRMHGAHTLASQHHRSNARVSRAHTFRRTRSAIVPGRRGPTRQRLASGRASASITDESDERLSTAQIGHETALIFCSQPESRQSSISCGPETQK